MAEVPLGKGMASVCRLLTDLEKETFFPLVKGVGSVNSFPVYVKTA